jgi:2-octaprenyl-6-methoxyphenol hydroxylase
MNICLIGDSLTSLALAKNLINKNIKVFVYYKNIKNSIFQSRTIGISKNNFDFFDKEIIKFKKGMFWKIKQIEIYSEKNKNEKILNFESDEKELFLTVKNHEIYKLLAKDLKKNKLFKKILIKNNSFYKKILREKKYELIINCDGNNKISRNFFYNKINKSYNSNAYTTIIKHKNIKNEKAIQIFTKMGPVAFLPISNSETSIVFSIINNKVILNENEIKNLISLHNKNYKIKSFGKLEKFELSFSVSRNYYYKNLMAFGDSLHKIHPLAGQGFNMILRDINILSKIIQDRIDLGLQIDHLIYEEFEKKTKHFNFIFSSCNDFIYEFFKFDNKYKNNYLNQLVKFLGENKLFNKIASKYADQGLSI